ncbi:MAG: hypothetical protein ACYC26_00145 [Phycisphaerales bacterium]
MPPAKRGYTVGMGTFALLQADIAAPTVTQARQALAAVVDRGLPVVPADAGGIVRDAFGVLVKRLQREQAEQLHDAFTQAGYATVVVAEEQLLDLPPAKGTRCLRPDDDALMYADTLDRMHAIAWDQVLVMIAGVVVKTRFERQWDVTPEYRGDGNAPVRVAAVETNEISENEPMMQLLLGVEPWRLSVRGMGLNYGYLGERRTMNSAKNFARVLRDIAERAKAAVLSRGIGAMTGRADVLPVYPTKGAFEEELSWLAWKAGQA